MPHHYLTEFVAQTRDLFRLFRRIDFQFQTSVYCRCGRFQAAGNTEVAPHEPVCVRNKLFHAHNRWFQFRLCPGHMCFQPAVVVRVQAEYC